VRLFPNYRAEEERLFKKTGVFPIMHLMTIRRAVFERHPWIAMNLFKAFEEAKSRCFDRLRDFHLRAHPAAVGRRHRQRDRRHLRTDPYPYGVEASRPTIEAFCRYAHAQGVDAQAHDSGGSVPAGG